MRTARSRLLGWLLEAVGNGGPRGMIIAPVAGNRAGEQNPAYVLVRPPFIENGTLCVAVFLLWSSMSVNRIARRWQGYLTAVAAEYAQLSASERSWIDAELARIAALQQQLDDLFRRGDGPAVCRRCHGACCDCGKNHFTLVNLLVFLAADELPPEPDFSCPCPFLGPAGCRLEVSRRPFNCVTFICEAILDPLGDAGYDAFHELEGQLRRCYLNFDQRYAGSSLRGLLIRGERLAGRPFLEPLTARHDR